MWILPVLQLLLTLRFYATGGYLRLVGDTFGVSASSVTRIVRRVSRYISMVKEQYVQFPNAIQRTKIQTQFYERTQIPGVVGVIDCVHIPISNPGGDNSEVFRNRKGYFSINVQVTCDYDLYITSFVARWHGSAHDSRIFENSAHNLSFENRTIDGILLADNGYTLKPNVMTPVMNPYTRAERSYNYFLCRGRVRIENVFGILKSRFPCLTLKLRIKLATSILVINGCAILHNYAKLNNIPIPDAEDEFHDDDVDETNLFQDEIAPVQNNGGQAVRRNIIRRFDR